MFVCAHAQASVDWGGFRFSFVYGLALPGPLFHHKSRSRRSIVDAKNGGLNHP